MHVHPDPESCLILFAKQPVPGLAKTRLTPPLAPAQAARLYRAFLADVVGESRAFVGPTSEVWLAVLAHGGWPPPGLRRPAAAPPGDAPLPDPPDVPWLGLLRQEGPDLSARLQAAFEVAFRNGLRRVVVRNTDSPLLPPERVREAFAALREPGIECVLGPDFGGGYYLVGLDQPRPELFADLARWGRQDAASVFDETLAAARSLGLGTLVLAEEADVDVPGDLARLATDLERSPGRALRTRAALTAIAHPSSRVDGES